MALAKGRSCEQVGGECLSAGGRGRSVSPCDRADWVAAPGWAFAVRGTLEARGPLVSGVEQGGHSLTGATGEEATGRHRGGDRSPTARTWGSGPSHGLGLAEAPNQGHSHVRVEPGPRGPRERIQGPRSCLFHSRHSCRPGVSPSVPPLPSPQTGPLCGAASVRARQRGPNGKGAGSTDPRLQVPSCISGENWGLCPGLGRATGSQCQPSPGLSGLF